MSILEIQAKDGLRLQALADIMADSRRVIVMTGAGISTNSGIPDFRSEGGLYTLIQEQFDAKAQAEEHEKASQQLHSDEGYYDMSLSSSMMSNSSTDKSVEDETNRPEQSDPLDRSQDSSVQLEGPDSKVVDASIELENDDSIEDAYESLSSSQASQITDNGRRALSSKMKGKDLFDARIWADPLSTSVFYTFIAALRKKIRQEVQGTTATHKFIRTLRDGGRLVRCYTQNIDGLEAREGLSTNLGDGKGNRARLSRKVLVKPRPESRPAPKTEMDGGCEVVQLHGDLEVLRCGLCQDLCTWNEENTNFEQTFLDGKAPVCQGCIKIVETRQSRGRRATAIGTLRPNVVLYGEGHPSEDLISEMSEHDLGLGPDLLLIIGTSLRVHGLKVLIREFAKSVHCRSRDRGKVVFVNNTKPADSSWGDVIDYWVNMDCDEWIEDMKTRRADLWRRQGDPRLPRRKSTAAYLKNTVTGGGELEEVVTAAKILLEMSSSPPRPKTQFSDRDETSRSTGNESKPKVKRKYRRKTTTSVKIHIDSPRRSQAVTSEPHLLPPSPMTPTTRNVFDQLQAEYRCRPIPTPTQSAKSSLTYILCHSPEDRKRKYNSDQPRALQDISINLQTPTRQAEYKLKNLADDNDQIHHGSGRQREEASYEILSPSKTASYKPITFESDPIPVGNSLDRILNFQKDDQPFGKRRRIISKRAAGLD